MNFLPFRQRQSLSELMDAPDVPEAEHRLALEGLARINRSSRAAAVMVGPIVGMVRRAGLTRISMLDVACGGGDVPVAVAGLLGRAGVGVELTLMDRSAVALEKAGRCAAERGVAARCVVGEAPAGLPEGRFDVVTDSLFLHHLTAGAVVETLAAMQGRARRMVVVSDLRRSLFAWVLAWAGCRILSRSRIVHYDGPVSVRCAWTVAEMRGMAGLAGMAGARVRGCWPWRMLLTWEAQGAIDA